MDGLTLVFTVCAVVGGALFVIRLILQFVAGMDDMDVDGVDADGGDVDLSDSDVSFKLLSLQGITAFLMIFGLAGRALLLESKVAPTWAILGAVVAGAFAVWVIAKIFTFMKRLQSSGGKLDLQQAIGKEGSVYLTIPAGEGMGKVTVAVQNRLGEFDAVSVGDEELQTGVAVEVVEVRGPRTLVVKKK